MGQRAEVYFNEILCGFLFKSADKYVFEYEDDYYKDNTLPAISLTLPKDKKRHISGILFPFFYGLLSEGDLKSIQCRKLGIDENDNFTRLIKTACYTIGAVSIREPIL